LIFSLMPALAEVPAPLPNGIGDSGRLRQARAVSLVSVKGVSRPWAGCCLWRSKPGARHL